MGSNRMFILKPNILVLIYFVLPGGCVSGRVGFSLPLNFLSRFEGRVASAVPGAWSGSRRRGVVKSLKMDHVAPHPMGTVARLTA